MGCEAGLPVPRPGGLGNQRDEPSGGGTLDVGPATGNSHELEVGQAPTTSCASSGTRPIVVQGAAINPDAQLGMSAVWLGSVSGRALGF